MEYVDIRASEWVMLADVADRKGIDFAEEYRQTKEVLRVGQKAYGLLHTVGQ